MSESIANKYRYIFEVRHGAFFSFGDEERKELFDILNEFSDDREYEVKLLRNSNNINDQIIHIKNKKNINMNVNLGNSKFDAGMTSAQLYNKVTENPVYPTFKKALDVGKVKNANRIGYRVILTKTYKDYEDVRDLFSKYIRFDDVFDSENASDLSIFLSHKDGQYNISVRLHTESIDVANPLNVDDVNTYYNLNIDIDMFFENAIYNSNDFEIMHKKIIKKLNDIESVMENE